ncbi:MAG: ComEC/Rec2 family competence protein, partial [Thermodesulfobacteriota bacterium]|nr:ComEC/Rec2 family competence protein [Thermodesulfobacteriota bacterium]
VLSALITGKKDLLDKKTRNDFSKAGASHVLAISGLHLSVVATLFFYLFNKILSLFTFLLIRGWSKKGAALLTLIPLLFYAFLSGFSPSTKRAFIMITVFMFSFVAAREADTLNSLAFAGILILFIDPGSIFSISFQLSFAAVLFIILGLFSIKKIEFFKEKNLQNRFFLFVFISFCAIAGTLPIVVYYFNIISFAGIFTNIVLIPGAGFFAVPLGLAGLFIYPVSMAAAALFIKCAGWILFFCILFIEYAANLSFAWARCVTPDMIEILCYYIFAAGIFFFINFYMKVHPDDCNDSFSKFAVADAKIMLRPCRFYMKVHPDDCNDSFSKFAVAAENDHAPAMPVYKKKAFVSVLAVLMIFLINEALWINQRFFNKKLYVTVMDVGQGSSALIEMPMGKRVLVDGGGFTYFSKFDTGEHIVAPFLWKKKIMTLDAVILSHPDADHMNGLVYILKNFKVKRFIKNCDTRETKAFLDLMNFILINNIKLDIVSDMETKINMGTAFLDILYPFYGADNSKVKAGDLNNNSVVFKLCFNNISILFPGDIMEQTEEKLASTLGKRLESDILIAPHHGSLTSSSNFFLDQVRPESVIVSCGWKNRFGFPDLAILQRYRQRGVKVFRTDLSGAVQITVGSEQLKIEN